MSRIHFQPFSTENEKFVFFTFFFDLSPQIITVCLSMIFNVFFLAITSVLSSRVNAECSTLMVPFLRLEGALTFQGQTPYKYPEYIFNGS